MIAGIIEALRAKHYPFSVRAVWQSIENRANGHTREPVATQGQIAEELGCNRDTVRLAICMLERDGILTSERLLNGTTKFVLQRRYVNGHAQPEAAPMPENPAAPPMPENPATPPPMPENPATPLPENPAPPLPENPAPYTKTPLAIDLSPSDSPSRADARGPRGEELGGLFGPTAQPARVAPVKPKPAAEPEGWAAFWAAYPRKVAKATARAAYARKVRDGAQPALILAGLRRFSFSGEERFIPHPATWLNAERWTDVPSAAAPTVYGPTKEGQIAFAEEARIRAVWEARQAARA